LANWPPHAGNKKAFAALTERYRAELQLHRYRMFGSHQLAREVRAHLATGFAEDNALLCRLLGGDYSDWLSAEGRGMYTVRKS
jgi:hypothetical protein